LLKTNNQQIVFTTKLRILAKSIKKKRVTIEADVQTDQTTILPSAFQLAGFDSTGVYQLGTNRFVIPLDAPLEDNLTTLLRQVRVNLPRNVELDRKEIGRGEEAIWIGGKRYYCSWIGNELTITVGLDRLVTTAKVWRCIDVPLDGVVRSEQETPFYMGKYVLVDYGFGTR
jgi:hypothetical protein